MQQDPPEELTVRYIAPYQHQKNEPPAPTNSADRRSLWVQEVTRAAFAGSFVIFLMVITIIALVKAQTWDQTREVLEIVLPILAAILGSVATFYYIDHRKN